MSRYKDSFGVSIAEGDIIYTASSQGGQAKIGRAYFAPHSLMVADVMRGRGVHFSNAKRQPVGSHILVLMRADGSLPSVMHLIMNGEFG